MCRLLGITNYNFADHTEILKNFAALAKTGKLYPGDPPGHEDGWGLAWYEDGQARIYKSAGSLAKEEDAYYFTLERAAKSPVLLAHLRKSAWPQTTTVENAHPFMKDNYVFAHNGTVRDYKTLLKDIAVDAAPPDDALDTEVFFRYLLGFIATGSRNAFQTALDNIRRQHTYSSLTSLFSDGKKLYALREFIDYPDYYSLFNTRIGNADIVASEPLLPAAPWHMLEKGIVLEFPGIPG